MAHRKTLDAVLTIVVAWAVLFTVPFFVPQVAWPLNLEIGFVTTVVLVVFSMIYFYPSRETVDETRPIAQVELKRREWNADDVIPPMPIESVASFLKMPNAEKMLKDWLRKKLPDFRNVQVKSMSIDGIEGWREVSGIVQDSNLVPYRFTLFLHSKVKIDKKKSYVE